MNTFLTEDTKAVTLLCGVFGNDRTLKPLTQGEYNALVRGLVAVKLRPADLLRKDHIPDVAKASGLDLQRLELLLGRGVQMGFVLEEWQRSGVWVLSRSDDDYPARLKKHLKEKAPALLFGVGKSSLLTGGGVAIVGSRNVDKDGEEFTRITAETCAANRMEVVSGGARGVDQVAMTAALNAGGHVIGVVAENLLRKSLERTFRLAIADSRLVLISPSHPNARFTVGTAMARNKLIYAMADYGLVVQCDYNKGGTWTGAAEELKRATPRPVFVRTSNAEGNCKLLELGAIAWPEQPSLTALPKQLSDLVEGIKKKHAFENTDLFDYSSNAKAEREAYKSSTSPVLAKENEPAAKNKTLAPTLYDAVLPFILTNIESPLTPDELAQVLDVNKTQLNAWLKKAVADKRVKKISKPVRYQAIKPI